jgi:capsid protein
MPKAAVPSTPSHRTVERRPRFGGTPSYYPSASGNNTLIHGATQNGQRTTVPFLDKDTHRTVSNFGRRTLMSLGRWLFWNFPAISGAILEQAMFASENFQPQFWGKDKDWGNEAEAWLLEWEKICDVSGWPYDMQSYRELLVLSDIREGDMATLLTETDAGYPQIQVWPAHRIGTCANETEVSGGPLDGLRIIDGVIVNDYRRPVAYRLADENGSAIEDVPASNMFLSFLPKTSDQVRGYSGLASAVFDCQDLKESKYWELIAQKAAAAVALLETNPTGDVDASRAVIRTKATHTTGTGDKATLDQQELNGGLYRYFKSGTNSDLKAFAYDRPGSNTITYQDHILRDAFQGIEWNMFFSNDPSRVGGASMRIIVEKINRVVRKRQRMIVQSLRRIHGYAIAKAIKLGLLPMSDEWWKWEYQLPAQVTADKRYDSDVDLQEYESRFTTLRNVCGRRGEYWEDIQDQWLIEQKRLQDRAKEIGVDLATVPQSAKGNAGPVQFQQTD